MACPELQLVSPISGTSARFGRGGLSSWRAPGLRDGHEVHDSGALVGNSGPWRSLSARALQPAGLCSLLAPLSPTGQATGGEANGQPWFPATHSATRWRQQWRPLLEQPFGSRGCPLWRLLGRVEGDNRSLQLDASR